MIPLAIFTISIIALAALAAATFIHRINEEINAICDPDA